MFNVYISYAEADRLMYEVLFTRLQAMGATIWSFNNKEASEINNEARYCIYECTVFLLVSPKATPLSNLMHQELEHVQLAQKSGGSLNILLGATSLTDLGNDFSTGWYVVPSERQPGDVSEEEVQRLIHMLEITHQSEDSLKTMTKEAILLYLYTLYIHDQYEEMIQLSIMLMKNEPTYVEGWVLYSKALSALDLHQQLVEAMKSALVVNENEDLLFVILANGYICMRQFKKAFEANEQALSISPDRALVHLQRAHIQLHLKQPLEAEKAIETTRRLAPYLMQTEIIYAELLCKYGRRYDDALAAINRFLVIDPKNISALLATTIIYTLKRQFQMAETPLQKALIYAPQNAHVLQVAGRVAEKQQFYAKASDYYKKSYALSPVKQTKQAITRVNFFGSGASRTVFSLTLLFLSFSCMALGMLFIDPLIGVALFFAPFLTLFVFAKSMVFLQNRLSRSR